MSEHEVGKCDICHKDFSHQFGCHGYFYGVRHIVLMCDECWVKEGHEL